MHGKNGVHDGNVEILALTEIYEVSVSTYFVTEIHRLFYLVKL
jgi:hypothetical protein